MLAPETAPTPTEAELWAEYVRLGPLPHEVPGWNHVWCGGKEWDRIWTKDKGFPLGLTEAVQHWLSDRGIAVRQVGWGVYFKSQADQLQFALFWKGPAWALNV